MLFWLNNFILYPEFPNLETDIYSKSNIYVVASREIMFFFCS